MLGHIETAQKGIYNYFGNETSQMLESEDGRWLVGRVGVAGGKASQIAAASSHGLDCSTGEVVILLNFHPQNIVTATQNYKKRKWLTIQIYIHSINSALLLS